jgi:hypothetical protein
MTCTLPPWAVCLPGPPQVHLSLGPVAAGSRTRNADPVGADQGAVHGDVRMTGGAGGQQCPTQPRRCRGEHVDALVQVPVGRRGADPVVDGQLGQPGAVEEPAQHQHRLPIAAQRPPPTSGAAAAAFGGE